MININTDAAGVVQMAKRLRAAIEAIGMEHAASPFGTVTMSVGMATTTAGPDIKFETLLAEANRGVYRAKADGRNRACWAQDQVIPASENLLEDIIRSQPTRIADHGADIAACF